MGTPAGTGESAPEGSTEWERISSIIDFNFTRPNGTGGTAGWLGCIASRHAVAALLAGVVWTEGRWLCMPFCAGGGTSSMVG